MVNCTTSSIGSNVTDVAAITSDFYRTWVEANGAVDHAVAETRFFKQNLPSATAFVDAAAFNIIRCILRGQQYSFCA